MTEKSVTVQDFDTPLFLAATRRLAARLFHLEYPRKKFDNLPQYSPERDHWLSVASDTIIHVLNDEDLKAGLISSK
jgi:hypothetical protein